MYKDPLKAKEHNRLWSKKNAHKKNVSSMNWAKRNPEKARGYHIKSKYNITLDEYNELLNKQNHVCAICFKPGTAIHNRNGKIKPLSIDHCHKTGKVRGLLCHRHNMAVGAFSDSIIELESAKQYLLRNT